MFALIGFVMGVTKTTHTITEEEGVITETKEVVNEFGFGGCKKDKKENPSTVEKSKKGSKILRCLCLCGTKKGGKSDSDEEYQITGDGYHTK